MAVVIWIHNCLFFTFYILCSEKKTAGKDAEAGNLVLVHTRGPVGKSGHLERAQLANQIQGFRTSDRSDAWENNNLLISFSG